MLTRLWWEVPTWDSCIMRGQCFHVMVINKIASHYARVATHVRTTADEPFIIQESPLILELYES